MVRLHVLITVRVVETDVTAFALSVRAARAGARVRHGVQETVDAVSVTVTPGEKRKPGRFSHCR